jgi:integrase
MARGSIKKEQRKDGPRYIVTVDLGPDPVTGERRQRRQTYRTKKEAERRRSAWLAEIDKGTTVDRSTMTMAELMSYWLQTYARHHVRPKSYEDYEGTIRVHIVPALGHVPLQKLKPEHLQTFYSDKLSAGCGKRTVELCHLRLSQALKMAVELDLVARNVAQSVKPPRARAREMQTWDTAQVQLFLAAASQSCYGPIWAVVLATGMRRGEVLGLRWQDVDFERRVLHVRQAVVPVGGAAQIGPTKNSRSRAIQGIPPYVLGALREHRVRQNERRLALGAAWQDHGLVFPSNLGTPINPRNLGRDYDRWVAQAGVPRIRIHDQRHTHASLMLQMGTDIKVVSERLGHARTSITMDIYAHVTSRQHIEAGDRIGAAIFGTGEGVVTNP